MSSIVVNNTPVVPDADADAARTRKIEGLRKTLYGLGAFQLFWGLLGMLIAFCWLSNLLTLCCGAIAVNNFSTLNGVRANSYTRGPTERRAGKLGAGTVHPPSGAAPLLLPC